MTCSNNRGLWLIFALWLSGCAIQPPTAPDSENRQWLLSGRIGLWQDQQKNSASLRWLRCGSFHDISLHGPLGAGGGRLRGSANAAVLEQSGSDTRRSESIDTLLQELGIPLPVAALANWLVGEPAEGARLSLEMDQSGRILSLEQLGWKLQFSRHRLVAGEWRPGRVDAQRDNTRLRFIGSDWRQAEQACAEAEAWPT